MFQSIVENLLVALGGAVAILLVLLMLGLSVAYQEELSKRGIFWFSKLILIAIMISGIVVLFLYNALSVLDTVIALLITFSLSLGFDWTIIRRLDFDGSNESEKES